jgi:nucleotide-binding universal stress UspA family protein
MQKLFTKILVPVNFNRNTGLALDKAIQLANHFDCDIHLIHVQTPASIPFLYNGFFSGALIKESGKKYANQLKELENRCKDKLHDGLLMTSAVVMGSWQSVLKQAVIAEHIDLVIIPKNRIKFGGALIQQIDLNKLSQQTQCPVLTVTRSFSVNHMQNIVVPINDSLPVRKLSIATYMCRLASGSIHLMGSGGNSYGGREKRRYLIKAYQLLSDYANIKIHCSLPDNYDNPASTLAYARNVKADLIVVNTGKESLLKGWWNRLRGKYLYNESDIPVLTIAH